MTAGLEAFARAGVLAPADVHVATTLAGLVAERDPAVLLAVALAVRAPRLGHVCLDLDTVRDTVAPDLEPADTEARGIQPWDAEAGGEGGDGGDGALDDLPWPVAEEWRAAVAASPLVSRPGDDGDRPLVLSGGLLYLDRYWRYERRVAEALTRRAAATGLPVDEAALAAGLDRLFPDARGAADLAPQRDAAEVALRARLAVVAGGPGTGKTWTVARILALADDQAAAQGARAPRTALVAPTGKAAARMQEAVAEAAPGLPVDEGARQRLAGAESSTIHRLLGSLAGTRTRFRHTREQPLPHDLVIVDETSMVSLALMAKLLDAVRDDARLVLVGDPQQLRSVEAGTVLSDIVGPADHQAPPTASAEPGSLASRIVVLRRGHRFAGGIAALAEAVRTGDADGAAGLLAEGTPGLRWLPTSPEEEFADPESPALAEVREAVVAAAGAVLDAARAGDGAAALRALGRFRVLCPHRLGPAGVSHWTRVIERWLVSDLAGFAPSGAWYVGRPVLVTANDYQLHLFNGDTGVVTAGADGQVTVVFDTAAGPKAFRPSRLGAVETVHAMTVHKSQGSQFAEVVAVLPDPSSRVLSRELLYTAVTRAQERFTVVGPEESLRAAIARPVQRASGLAGALRHPPPPTLV